MWVRYGGNSVVYRYERKCLKRLRKRSGANHPRKMNAEYSGAKTDLFLRLCDRREKDLDYKVNYKRRKSIENIRFFANWRFGGLRTDQFGD